MTTRLMATLSVLAATAALLHPLCHGDDDFAFSRDRFDAIARTLDESRDLAKLDGSKAAWGESYVMRAYLEMYQATGDRAYLRRFAKLADGVLACRDDVLGLTDHAGRSLPLWGIAGKFTVATATVKDEQGREALAVRSIRYAYNDQTIVTVEEGTEPGTWRLSHRNPFWEEHGPGRRQFDNLSLDPGSPRYIETVVNDPGYVPELDVSRELEEEPSYLLVVSDSRPEAAPAEKTLAAVEVSLKPKRLAYWCYIGPIYSPLTRFAFLVKEDPGLQDEFAAAAARYVAAAEESLAVWEPSWRDGPDEGEGYYLLTPKGEPFWCDGIGAPFNYLCAAGQVMLYLHDVTGKAEYRKKAEGIARLLKNRLELRENGAYVWQYWWGPGAKGWSKADGLSVNTPTYPPRRYDEDISHGAWAIEFAVQARQRGIVFDEQDMERFAATFMENLWVADTRELTDRVNGNRERKGSFNLAGGRWSGLCEFEPAIFECMRQIFAEHKYAENAYGQQAAVYARLYRWQVKLAPEAR